MIIPASNPLLFTIDVKGGNLENILQKKPKTNWGRYGTNFLPLAVGAIVEKKSILTDYSKKEKGNVIFIEVKQQRGG